jgi:hypothetical protein
MPEEEKKWYKNTGLIIALTLAITPVIISQALDVYISIINSATDFQVHLDPVNIGTDDALKGGLARSGSHQMTIVNQSKVIGCNCHSINPYNYEIFLSEKDGPPGINITFDPPVLRLPDINQSNVIAEVSSDVITGDHQVEIEAIGGDGTKHSCYCIITVKKDSNMAVEDLKKEERAPEKLVVSNETSPPSGVSQTQASRPVADVRTVGVTQDLQISRPTGSVR